MARSSRAQSLVVAVTIALFVVTVALQLFVERPIGLAGLELDRSLRIAEGSRLPSPDLRVGDEVVAVNGLEVESREDLAFALRRASGRSAVIRVALQGGEETLLLSASDVDGDAPAALTGQYRVIRIGGAAPETAIDFDEIRFRVMRASPEPLEVVITRGGQMEGTMAIAVGPPGALGALWLLFGAIGVAIAVLTNLAPLSRGKRVARLGVVAAALGGVAAPAMAAASISEHGALLALVWGTTLAATWRAYSFMFHVVLARGERALEPAHVLLIGGPGIAAVVAGVVFVVQGMVGVAPFDASWRGQVLQIAFASVLLVGLFTVADLVVHLRRLPGRGPAAGAVVSLLGIVVFGAAAFREGMASVSGPALLWLSAAVTAQWLGDLVPFVPFGERRRRLEDDESAPAGGGVASILADAPSLFGEREVRVCVGVGPAFVGVRRTDMAHTGDARLSTALENETASDALAMLAVERRSLPFAGLEDDDPDALSGLAERLGWDAARPVPLGDDAGIDAYVVIVADPEGLHPAVDLDIADAFAARFAASRPVAELVAAASSELVQAARWASRGTGDSSRSATDAVRAAPTANAASQPPAAAPSPVATTTHSGAFVLGASPATRPATRRDAGWIEWLERAAALEYPVDDPEVLTDRERRGFRFVADSDRPALIVGEPGSGKELVARAIHRSSTRGRERVAVLDASLVPPSVVDLEIFGDRDHPGLAEVVDGGTLIIKSLSAVGPSHVERLAHRIASCGARAIFIERYLGNESGVPRSVPDVIRELADDRTLHIAPLRDRRSDVPRLARYFLHRTAMRYGRIVVDLDDDALDYLQDLEYPANFHDLRAIVLAGVIRCGGERLRRLDLAPWSEPDGDLAPMSPADEEREKAEILAALKACDNNRSEAARRLGITRGKLLRRLQRFSIG